MNVVEKAKGGEGMIREDEGFSIKFGAQPEKPLFQEEGGIFDGKITGLKIYPIALTSKQLYGIYKRGKHWWGILLNDVDHYLKRSLT